SSHDQLLIAQLAADDVTSDERTRAEAQLADCERCRDLLIDLRLISAATADLPAPRRTRDFRLTDADAARLNRGPRAWLARLGPPRFAFVQPLGVTVAALGLVGLLIGVLPAGLVGVSSTSAPAPTAAPARNADGVNPAASSTSTVKSGGGSAP